MLKFSSLHKAHVYNKIISEHKIIHIRYKKYKNI